MNNEITKSPKNITTVLNTSTSTNNNNSTANISSSSTTASLFSSISPSLSFSSSAPQTYSTSAQFDVTVSAIAAVVNASNNLPITTPPDAAAVVAVAVSSLAAAIIPDTPIVSIAGSTLSEITTTTTSTKTTPTPVPTSKEPGGSYNSNCNKNLINKNLENKTSSSSHSTSGASVKGSDPMSVANSSVSGALTNASTTANASAAENNNTSSIKQIKDNSTGNTAKGSNASSGIAVNKSESLLTAVESKSIIANTSLTSSAHSANVANSTPSKTDDFNVTPNKTKSKNFLSESWEESRLKDWDDSKLKELLDEAYSYKNPRDKENKSKTFLQLLEKAENEDQSYPFCVTSRGSRNLSNSITSNSYHHYQQNLHYHSHSHNHNRSHHHHKQGGSLQDLFEIGLHESQLDCEQTFGIGISGNQRIRRQNHNSRQKKYSSSVSSRQREGGSLPSNVNVTHQLSVGGGAVANDLSFMKLEVACGTSGTNTTTNTSKNSKKEQRRNASKAATNTTTGCSEEKENNSTNSVCEVVANSKQTNNTNSAHTSSGGDFIIDMGEPMMNIQQQQKILQCKGQDATTQGHPFYERLANSDKRIPRANIIGSTKGTYFAPTTSHCYVDETVRFNALERNGGTNNGPTLSTIDAKFLPLDENYKSCKSVLGCDGDKSSELLGKSKSNTIYTKISSPASGSAILSGTTSNIATLTQRQLDENGNALSEIYQNTPGSGSSSGATIQINAVSPTTALLNSCGNVSTSATVTISPHTASTTVSASATVTTTYTSGPSQAKAKTKKKSQQERNTKTVDVESVAGYRGKDPVEVLVKYIESSGEDKQVGSGSKSGDKKKERKKDKEKHQKLKKSNSLEELRSGAKMEVHELKRTAATTESNAVLVRQKSGGTGRQNKNSSYSTADINKNIEGKNPTQTTNSRKSDRRSWGNEDLKYLEDDQNLNITNEEKSSTTATIASSTINSAKDRKNKIGGVGGGCIITSSKEEKDIKDKTNERNERNLANIVTLTTIHVDKSDKLEKAEKLEKSEKSERCEKSENKLEKLEKRKKQDIPSNAVTVVDILAIESVLPETAEFHVVTKKKKPKKQKVINNLEETTVTFNRTHNFTMQKTSTFNQQQQQMTVRYKYYHHDNSSNTCISNINTNSQNYQQLSSQQHQQLSNINSNVFGAISSHHHTQSNQNQQQPRQQQQQHNATESCSNINDKSRRKSTSSVPPSEKSDSSDLDSVHSLPIESSKANVNNKISNTNKVGNTQQKTKIGKNNNAILGYSRNHNVPAPISYADIARTNKEIADAAAASASGILINNNEISTECRNAADALETDLITADDKTATIVNAAITTAPNATTKPHKIRKSQNKQDFPELSGTSAGLNDDKFNNTSANHKAIITYSQSLTAVTNPSQNAISNQSHESCGAIGNVTSASDSSPSSSEIINKVSTADQHTNLIVHQHANIFPVQHQQQQLLQKSKSVENDSITTSTNSSLSSAASYMTSLNTNNLDQQYPALEKTVKRHSSANVAIIGMAINANTNNQPYNFAAAAKQQFSIKIPEQHTFNANNKNSALTTSNTNSSNNTNQTTLLSSSGVGGTALCITANKKSKEKSPQLLSTTNLTLTTQHTTLDGSAFNANTNTTTAITSISIANSKKSKKERQQQQQQSSVESFQTKQNQNNACSNTVSNKKLIKPQLKSSNSLPLGFVSSTNSTHSTISANRPAVIILNDYRNSGSCAADNQFTFGDFNEEELKLFDDDHNSAALPAVPATAAAAESRIDNMEVNEYQSEEEDKHERTPNSEAAIKPPASTVYFNDSGASCGNDLGNSSTDMLSSSIDASSPNTSFVGNNHGNSGVGALHMPALNNNQSSDSGIYVDKVKSSNSSCSSSSSVKCCTNDVLSEQKQMQLVSPTKEETNKLNTFLSNTRCASVNTSMDSLDPPPPPPQQLETCNDIETAIIAAARAAAKHQPIPSSYREQQQKYKNSNTSSNSSSFSSSSLSSTTSAHHHHYHHQHYQQQQHHRNINSNKNQNKYQNQHGRCNIMSYRQSHGQYNENYDNEEDDNDNDSLANTPRSRSPSRPRRISIAGGTVTNKEFDIHFIPPTTMPTAFSTQQHNDIIIEFIGSAWEEVANSKVTKVYYDGQ